MNSRTTDRPRGPFVWFGLALATALACTAGCRTVRTANPELAVAVDRSHFPALLDVLLSNRTAQAVRIWEWANSWGWDNLSVQIQEERKRELFWVVRKETSFSRNGPTFDVLGPQESLIRKINTGDGWWTIPPGINLTNDHYRLRVRLRIAPSREARKCHVFVGEVYSDWK